MRHLRRAVLAVVAVALCAAPVAVAHHPKGGGAVVAPAHKAAGLTGDELLGEAWVQLLSHPADAFSGSCLPVGHKGRVVAPQPGPDFESSCTVKQGTRVFFFIGSDCSNVEEDPFFGEDEAEQAACAIAADEFFVDISITVDDGDPVDIRNPRFELLSPQRTVELAEDNFLGVDAGPATFVAHGWGALVKKLRPGEHTITVVVTDAEGVTTTARAFIDVVRDGHDHGHNWDDKHPDH
jgi:hypothetical protein